MSILGRVKLHSGLQLTLHGIHKSADGPLAARLALIVVNWCHYLCIYTGMGETGVVSGEGRGFLMAVKSTVEDI